MGKKVRISDESVNCYGTRVLTSGIDLTQYQRNPVLLYMHERGKVVGLVKNLEVKDGELLGELEFDKASPLSVQLEKQYQFGSLRMVSADFRILETSDDKALAMEGQTCQTVTKCELFEVSAVDIGGNDNALVLSDVNGKEISLVGGEDGKPLLPLLNNNIDNNPLKKSTEMETKYLALSLGLASSATDAEVSAKIEEMKLAQQRVKTLEDEVKQLKDQQDKVVLSAINQAVDDAVKQKRIGAGMKDHFVKLGKAMGLEELKTTLDAMQPQMKLSEQLNHGNGGNAPLDGDFSQYQKLSAVPEDKMQDLMDNHQPEYVRLFKAEYGCEPTKLR